MLFPTVVCIARLCGWNRFSQELAHNGMEVPSLPKAEPPLEPFVQGSDSRRSGTAVVGACRFALTCRHIIYTFSYTLACAYYRLGRVFPNTNIFRRKAEVTMSIPRSNVISDCCVHCMSWRAARRQIFSGRILFRGVESASSEG